MKYISTTLESLKLALLPQPATQKIKILSLALVTVIAAVTAQPALAAVNYNDEIKRLQNQNNNNASNRSNLQTQAVTMESKIADLQATIVTLEAEIQTNQAQRQELAAKIVATEQEIVRQKQLLGVSVRKLYIDSDISMLEKMASSSNLSEYVEKEEYGLSVQNEVQKGIDRVNQLKTQQEAQKSRVEQLLADNTAMQSRIASEKQEVARLLAMNQEQQATYTKQISTNNSSITDLQRQQAEENARLLREQEAAARAARQRAAEAAARRGAPAPAPMPSPQAAAASAGMGYVDGRSYPWANAPFPNEIVDRWGMYQRQCVSYTAWKVAASGRHMPYWGGRGNANQWDDNARAAGIPVDSTPRVGDIAVSNRGHYGHVMYVEAVNGDGTIRISQYNAGWDGRYSEATIVPNGLVFIHFR